MKNLRVLSRAKFARDLVPNSKLLNVEGELLITLNLGAARALVQLSSSDAPNLVSDSVAPFRKI